jgi:hypothetical protein
MGHRQPEGRSAWEAAGRPPVSTLVVGSRTTRLLSPRFQIARSNQYVFLFYAQTEDSWFGRQDVWRPAALRAANAAILERLRDQATTAAFVGERLSAGQLFVAEPADADPGGERTVQNPDGGTLAFRDLLDMQRQHGAQHLRQVLYTYDQAGIAHAGHDPRELVSALELPKYPF